ncbi:GNAT family N-acetyltransferase [Dactylosporangium cerinum]|uniref:GNAT family N-acetyltransferase n=1 Tax=Dactylosporangium cerinum TaxID=1434730 RepID=A0ABV9VXS5_9ACTN
MQFTIRAVRAEDWPLAKELRLAGLQDPVASIAFLDTYERSVALPDELWQGRTADAAEGKTVRQFIGEDGDGRWLGTVTVLVEPAGVQDYFGQTYDIAQTHVVGVYVRPEARGTGLAPALFEAALAWSWALPDPSVERVRLYVHEDNARAQALYEKAGFTRTGVTVAAPAGREFEYAVARD